MYSGNRLQAYISDKHTPRPRTSIYIYHAAICNAESRCASDAQYHLALAILGLILAILGFILAFLQDRHHYHYLNYHKTNTKTRQLAQFEQKPDLVYKTLGF